MPGYIVHMGATVTCLHGGQAMPTVTDPRVKVGGQPIVTLPAPWTIAGCTFPPPTSGQRSLRYCNLYYGGYSCNGKWLACFAE